MNSAELRQGFLDYFVSQGHQLVPSSPLIPAQDPTLLFRNACEPAESTTISTTSAGQHAITRSLRCLEIFRSETILKPRRLLTDGSFLQNAGTCRRSIFGSRSIRMMMKPT